MQPPTSNSTIYIVMHHNESSDSEPDEFNIIGVYSSLEEADAVAHAEAKKEAASINVELKTRTGSNGLREYSFEPSEEDRTYYQITARVFDAEPATPVYIKQTITLSPPKIQPIQGSNFMLPVSFGQSRGTDPSPNPVISAMMNPISTPFITTVQPKQSNPRETIEDAIEDYIADNMRDFKDAQDWLKTIPVSYGKINRIQRVWTEYLLECEPDVAAAYRAEKVYADAYIRERAVDFLRILDPSHAKMTILGQWIVIKKA